MTATVVKGFAIITECVRELNSLKEFFEKEKDNVDYDNAKIRLKLLETLHDEMKVGAMDLIIALKDNEDEKKKVRERVNKFTNSFATIHAAFARLIRKRDEHNEANKTKIAQQNLPAPAQVRAVKIKAIEVPNFDGSVDKWTSYRDVFESII